VMGVQAGIAAGMEVWGFTGGGHADAGLGDRLAAAGAVEVFPRFSDMPGIA
jgi:beta-phosphoglucomutase-like phosphatase (HAD superfamily)